MHQQAMLSAIEGVAMQSIDHIFKAYDIRGKVGTELTPEFTEKMGRALAQWLPQKGPVAVGHDMRPDSSALAEGMMKGLQAGGRDVVDIGQVTSDMIYFAVSSEGLAGGAMITAIHNPGKDNGIKVCREEARPISINSGLLELRDLVNANQFATADTPGS